MIGVRNGNVPRRCFTKAEPRCSSCGVLHDRWRDAAHTLPASWCHECHASYMRANRPKWVQLSDEQRAKGAARAMARHAQRSGKLAPKPCERCGEVAVVKHHPDYRKPLHVVWLCRPCHTAEHARMKLEAKHQQRLAGGCA